MKTRSFKFTVDFFPLHDQESSTRNKTTQVSVFMYLLRIELQYYRPKSLVCFLITFSVIILGVRKGPDFLEV